MHIRRGLRLVGADLQAPLDQYYMISYSRGIETNGKKWKIQKSAKWKIKFLARFKRFGDVTLWKSSPALCFTPGYTKFGVFWCFERSFMAEIRFDIFLHKVEKTGG